MNKKPKRRDFPTQTAPCGYTAAAAIKGCLYPLRRFRLSKGTGRRT